MKYSRPRGTQDIFAPDVYTWQRVERVFATTFERFAYDPIRTPIFESTDLFLRSVGEETDIVSKEMYTFEDRGGRSVTLRPENTAAVIRAYLENGMHRLGGITRLCYTGPMFRYDRPQAGRYRQFHQVGVEAIGSMNPAVDVEVIDVVLTALGEAGFEDLVVKLNSVGCAICRAAYAKVLRKALDEVRDELCDDCKTRALKNPMRVFDCKRDESIKKRLPPISQHLCDECREHYERVKMHLDALGRGYEEDPLLVRGLDYYTKTTFEILHASLGAQNALCGGGRYDNLVEECGGPPTPAVGFSAGLERIISVLPGGSPVLDKPGRRLDFYVAVPDEKATSRALEAAAVLRTCGNTETDLTLRTLKKQLSNAAKKEARVVVIVDDTAGVVKWRDMATRDQVDVAQSELLAYAEKHGATGSDR